MRYTLFGQHTGLRVSTLVLGTGMFGTQWGHGADPTESRRMFDGSLEAGGNFLDTADTYQFGESESLLSAFVHATREALILASTYSLSASPHGSLAETGNNRKAMVRSLEASLKRLHTDRLDLSWVHVPDGMTPIDDIMRGFDDLVRAGTILYAGLSDFPAWRVARAATRAEWRGWVPLAGVQLAYSLVERTPERELLPMAAAFGLGTVAWSPLGGGVLTGKYRKGEMGRQRGMGSRLFHPEDTPQQTAILDTLEGIATETGATPGQLAIAWVAAKGALPLIGPCTRAQLEDQLGALTVQVSDAHLRRLDAVSAVALGFPHDFVGEPGTRQRLTGGTLDRLALPARPVV